MTAAVHAGSGPWAPSPRADARLDPASLPRILPQEGRQDWAAHLARFGALPVVATASERRGRRHEGIDLVTAVEAAGLLGRGGGGFPTGRKLRAAMQSGRTPVVIVNAMEGEPASGKDRVLLSLAPHLVLDGAEALCRALGARQVHLCVARRPDDRTTPSSSDVAARSVLAALAERPECGVEFVLDRPPHRYVAGESSALARFLGGGAALPEHRAVPLAVRGIGGRPTVLDNAETLSHVALVARFGPDWFRALGTDDEPGTVLVTVSGAVVRPAVTEVAVGTPLSSVLAAAGGTEGRPCGVLVGGYGGTWLGPGAFAMPIGLRRRPGVAALGPGIVVVLPHDACGLVEMARVVRYMANEGARQCGPCLHGLPALADALDRLVLPSSGEEAAVAVAQLLRWCDQIDGRGACNHPSGVVQFVRSGLQAFSDDVVRHTAEGGCPGVTHAPVLPL